MTRKSKIHEIRDYMLIAFAMIEGSIGLNIFLLPNHITMGGVGGIASILCWGFGIPVSVSYFALNVFLLIIAFRILGYKFCLKTIYGVADSSPARSTFHGNGYRRFLHGKQCRTWTFSQWFNRR